MLKIQNLSKSIGNKKILNEINFELCEGEIGIFLGGSGAGKSTLLRVLNRLEDFESGSFTLNNIPLDQTQNIGMVFQHFNLFGHMNAEENIIHTLIHCKGMSKENAKAISDKLLKRYGLQDKATCKVCYLSGGQKQRLAIARTLSVDPKIVCLDEPTSALDPRLTNQIAGYILELVMEKRIVILTTHDMNLLSQLDGKIFLMDSGSLSETALKSDFTHMPEAYPKLHNFFQGVA